MRFVLADFSYNNKDFILIIYVNICKECNYIKKWLKLVFNIKFIDTLHIYEYCFQYGRTEMIKNTLNPEFVKKFMMNYFFEESQKLRFDL